MVAIVEAGKRNGQCIELDPHFCGVEVWRGGLGTGYFNYHAVPGNLASLNCFRREVSKRWLGALRRRGQKHPMIWARLEPFIQRWLRLPKILHPYPNLRFDAKCLR